MARKTIQLPTTQEIEALYRQGNIEELRKINERLAKTANQRMAQFAHSHIRETESLKKAKYWIEQESGMMTGGVFSRSKKLNAELLVEQVKQEMMFLRSRSSTVSGEKQVRFEKSFESLTSGKTPYLEIPEDIEVPEDYEGTREEYFKDQFAAFLETDAWKDIKKYLYSTDTNILSEAGEAIARGASVQDLKTQFKKYLANEVSIFTMWDNWVSIK